MNLKPTLITLGLLLSVVFIAPAQQFKALVFSKTAGFRHQSIPDGVVALKKMGETHVFDVYTTEDARAFTDENLAKYDVVILMSTTGTIFNDEQKAAFQKYVQSGKGVVGIHSATDTEYEWPWYNQMIGAYFLAHPKQQTVRLQVLDKSHPSTFHLPDTWLWTDELYEFKNINPNIKVLINADETSYTVAKETDQITQWLGIMNLTEEDLFIRALGHVESAFQDSDFLKHLYGGIWWAAKGYPLK